MLGKHRNRADTSHSRSANEYGAKWVFQPDHLQIGLETVHLPAISVALHRDVEDTERTLVRATIFDPRCQQDHSCARAEYGQTSMDRLSHRFEQFGGSQQLRHCRRFTARHHQCLQPHEIPRFTNLTSDTADFVEHFLMGSERALQREHTNVDRCHTARGGYQPRSA